MCLKQSFCHYKWVLQSILSLTVLSNSVSVRSNFNTAFHPDCTKLYIRLLNRKFKEDSKNVLKIVILSLRVGFTGNFVLLLLRLEIRLQIPN